MTDDTTSMDNIIALAAYQTGKQEPDHRGQRRARVRRASPRRTALRSRPGQVVQVDGHLLEARAHPARVRVGA